jgi:threonine synthase
MSYFTHLECSVPCGAPALDPRGNHHLCACGAPLLARYDLDKARAWSRDSLRGRDANMWRYRELLPLFDGEEPVTLGEGFTPLFHTRALGATLGLDRLYVKDESLNPTNSFKARGQSAAITRAKYLGAKTIALPTAGNAGNAASAYAAAAGLACEVFIPKDAKRPFIDECRLYGANVTLVDGLITDAGRICAEKGGPLGWYDVSTLKEPYRIEGKKTMAYELAEQMNWTWPDWIVYPTGGGTGIVGMQKAFDELEELGLIGARRPRFVVVQMEGCAPLVRAFLAGAESATPWESPHTDVWGLRVPRAVADFIILRALRATDGVALAVPEPGLADDAARFAREEGLRVGPEGAAAMRALATLAAGGAMREGERVVVFQTGNPDNY